jgi:hypothetical protein
VSPVLAGGHRKVSKQVPWQAAKPRTNLLSMSDRFRDGECASDDQHRHHRLMMALTPEPRQVEEVLVKDCSDDEDDE